MYISTTHGRFWGNCLTQTVGGVPYYGLIESSSLDEEWNTPTEMSYKNKFPMCFHWVGNWEHSSFYYFSYKEWRLWCQSKETKKNCDWRIFIQNISYMRKAIDCLEYKILQPGKKKLFKYKLQLPKIPTQKASRLTLGQCLKLGLDATQTV